MKYVIEVNEEWKGIDEIGIAGDLICGLAEALRNKPFEAESDEDALVKADEIFAPHFAELITSAKFYILNMWKLNGRDDLDPFVQDTRDKLRRKWSAIKPVFDGYKPDNRPFTIKEYKAPEEWRETALKVYIPWSVGARLYYPITRPWYSAWEYLMMRRFIGSHEKARTELGQEMAKCLRRVNACYRHHAGERIHECVMSIDGGSKHSRQVAKNMITTLVDRQNRVESMETNPFKNCIIYSVLA